MSTIHFNIYFFLSLSLSLSLSFVDQIKLLNESVDASKFGPFLNRVISRLSEKNLTPFSEAELKKLCVMFKMNEKQLDDVIETCGYIFEQTAYWGAGSDALEKELLSAGLKSELVQAFTVVWDANGATMRANLADRTICSKQLEGVDFALHLQLGQQDVSRIKKTAAVFALTTTDQDQHGKEETINIEFTHEELTQFSKHLDTIQDQMDSLG